jgi:LuxR family maltose regulon positive regulatory protein
MLPLAQALYQRNQIVAAEGLLRNALELARRIPIPDVLWYGNVLLAELLSRRGALADAEVCLLQARTLTRHYHSRMLSAFMAATEARIWLRAGQLQPALDWAQQYAKAGKADYHQDYENLTLAAIWLADGALAAVFDGLASLIRVAQAQGRLSTVIEAATLQAVAYQAAGKPDKALTALQYALELAQTQGYIRVFLDAGQPLLKLLARARERGLAPTYIDVLREQAAPPVHPADVLTEREIEVLRYIAQGASNQAIAAALVLSVGTVKSHIHHLMDKLHAQNRTEAVRKARTLKILAD